MNLGRFKENTIYLEDCYKAIKDIPDKSIDMILTDPPYDIKSTEGGGMLKEKRLVNLFTDLKENELNIGINDEILNEWCRVMKKINIYIWCNKILIPRLMDFFVNQKDCMFDIIIWNKTNAIPLCGSKYLTDCEYCLYFHETLKLNTTYDTAKTVYYQPINIDDKKLFKHPTCKPTNILRNLIFNSSNEGDIILDTFMGSGSTAIACKELNRNYLGFEINEEYYQIAIDRLNGISQSEKKENNKTLFGDDDEES